MPKDDLNNLSQRLAEELSKYTQFLLAIAGAAIAYALEQAEGAVISWDSLLLIVALLLWCGSFYFGIRHLRLFRSHMIENAKAIMLEETFNEMTKRLEPWVEKMESSSNLQYSLFIYGVVFYIGWYFIEAL
jgi:hypothetical protein